MRPFAPSSGCFSVVLLKFTPRASGLTGNRKPNARECAPHPSSFFVLGCEKPTSNIVAGIQLMREKNRAARFLPDQDVESPQGAP